MIRYVFIIFITTLYITGCSTSQPQTNSYSDGFEFKEVKDTKFQSDLCVEVKKYNGNWKELVSTANRCVKEKNWNNLEKIGSLLAIHTPESPWGPYYLSLSSEGKGNLRKALWMSELAIRKAQDLKILYHQKARILYQLGDVASAEATLSYANQIPKDVASQPSKKNQEEDL